MKEKSDRFMKEMEMRLKREREGERDGAEERCYGSIHNRIVILSCTKVIYR